MRVLTRYVVLEVFKVFVVALTALTVMMILVGVVKEARENGLELGQILQIIPYVLPDALRYTVPGTILFAVSMVFGRMAGSNEIVALKSLGISPMAVLKPVLILALLVSVATVGLNDLAVWGRANVRRIVIEGLEEIAYRMLRTQRSFSARNFSIIVKRVDGRVLMQPIITFQATDKNPMVTLAAEEAELRSDTSKSSLTIVCRNGTVDVMGQGKLRFQDTIEREIPLAAASPAGGDIVLPAWLPTSELPKEAAKQQAINLEHNRSRAAKAALALLTGDFAALDGPEAQNEAEIMKVNASQLHRLRTEPHRRWANGFSCLCFVLIGAPMAIWRRNADFLTSFFACFLPILVLYYPVLALGVDQAKSGAMPPYSVWFGNVVVALVGVWLMRRVLRY